jgi:hypothetical protein
VSAVAGLAGSAISASAAQSAASTQAGAAEQASQNAVNENNQTVANLSPYTAGGTQALNSLESALGLPNTTANPTAANPLTANGISGLTFQPTQAQLAATPGYQFDLAQGLQATQNSNAAQGLGVSGAALKAADVYATGVANNTLTTQQGIFQQNLGNVLNPLQSLTGTGESAAAQTGSLGNQAIANANALQVGAANASAAGTVGSANAISSGLSSLGNTGVNYLLYNQLLNGGGFGGGGGYVDTTSTF